MLKRLAYVLSGHGSRFAGVLVFGVVLNVLFTVIDPLIIKLLVDRGLVQQDFRAFVTFALAVVLFGVLVRVGRWAYELLTQRLKNRINESISLRMLGAFYKVPFAEVRKAESGYFLSRIYDEPNKVAQGAIGTWIGMATQIMAFLAAAAVAFYLAWKITLLLGIVVPLLYYLANRFQPRITEASKTENEEEAKLRDDLGTAVGAFTTVQMFSLHGPVHQRIGRRVRSFLDVLYSRVRASKTYEMASNICMSLAEAAVLLAAGWAVVAGSLTIGGLFGFLNAFWKVVGAAKGLIGLVPQLAKLDGYIERLIEFERPAEEQAAALEAASLEAVQDGEARGEATEDEPARVLELDRVTMRFEDRALFEDFDLRVGEDENVLIVGPNGSGKSTLAYLLTGFLEPTEGTVRGPGPERVSALLTPFRFVPGTLKDNVGYDQLDDVAKERFWDLVDDFDLRDQIDQPTSELSAGERKKAQVLMTLLKDADVYIFDEPLANVDTESKDVVVRRQLERTRGKALVAILHGDERFHPLFDKVVPLEPAPPRDTSRHESQPEPQLEEAVS